ncbi:hypothetical protein FACS1894211_00050 [Clostridia bacterium]|nr:hypothetical protein FACS1894211_00050 [Clostridia bacterium]
MSYTMLYRKYRPKTFDALVGQEHVVRILTNQVMSGNVGHAYLFTGSRGVGKTSAAKLFARAINCLRPVNGSPCYKCAACLATEDPSNVDITEIDAASNNGVDEIRDLREKVKYPPVAVRRKVYIIDEVHMLTGAAFNAMLKTLEEPPAHAVFILATTEAHKLPATILSRCMRFDFRLVPIETLTGVLRGILADIKKDYEEEALFLLAAAAEGSVRDMLSLADMCVSYSEKKLRAADVSEILGAADFKSVIGVAETVLNGDGGRCIETIDRLISSGKSPAVLSKDLAAVFRALLIFKTCGDARGILHLTAEAAERYKTLAADAPAGLLFKCAENFARLDGEMRYSVAPRVLVEIACLELAMQNNAQLSGRHSKRGEESPSAQDKGQGTGDAPRNPAPRLAPLQIENPAVKSAEIAPDSPADEIGLCPAPRPPVVPVNPQQNSPPSEEWPPKADSAAVATPAADARRLWGKVVRGLREKGEFSLYAITSEKSAVSLRGKVLVLRLTDVSEYESLQEPMNVAAINGILDDTGYTFQSERVDPAGKNAREAFEHDLQHILDMGGDLVHISHKRMNNE